MTKVELLEMLMSCAKRYAKGGIQSVSRNMHMNQSAEFETPLTQQHLDAVVVDFVNYVALMQGVDLALYTSDLQETSDGT